MYLRCLFCVNSFRDLNTVLGNKKVELFDSAGEPTAEENVHMASCESLSTSVEFKSSTRMDETNQAIERSKQLSYTGKKCIPLGSLMINFRLIKWGRVGRQVATDKCIMMFLFLIVCCVIAIIVVKIVNPNNKDIRDIPGIGPPARCDREGYYT
ncbi:BnaA08g03470D [Brassica napus]|uniref:BnaA08g03470D protein n=1 Tax=Brassica napus TaxID=3708 RepID=A0A078HVJ6_BRANA|nr:BnaA08g03470D [Brassica napus]